MPEAASPATPPTRTFVEIARFHHAEPTKACTDVLEAEGIPFQLSKDSLAQGVAAYQVNYLASCIVKVPADCVVRAREALLRVAREEVSAGVEPDHPLATSDDETLLEVLRHPEDSSEFDLAVAERLLQKRGVTPPPISFEPTPAPPSLTADKMAADSGSDPVLPGTRRGSESALVFAFVMGSFGGVIGVIIGCNYALGTEAVPMQARRRYLYDEHTRHRGAQLALYSLAMMVLWLVYFVVVRQMP
jgi:hypothetical protein